MSKQLWALLLCGAALISGSWLAHRAAAEPASITVKLPPARPAPPHPGFEFQGAGRVD